MYVLTDVPKDILDILDTCINEKGLKPINDELAGNLKHEYSIPKGKAAVSPFLMRLIIEHQKKYPDFFKQAHSTLNYKHCEIELFNLWVNFQKQHEFNPMHDHNGIYSFVIWMKIPTSYEEQRQLPIAKKSNSDSQISNFGFIYQDILGNIKNYYYNMEKDIEGYLVLFPSKLLHLVNPFFNCEDERITISGNIGLT